jgi:hypothetical protein
VTAPPASPRRWRGGPLRRPATRFPGGVDGPRREARTRECGGESFWSAQADRRPEAFVPIEIGLPRRCAPGVGLRRRGACFFGRRRPTVGRRLLCRLKSAFKGADAPGVGLRRRGACFFGWRRPTVGRRPLEAEFIRRAGRPPAEGSVPIEIGLRRREEGLSGRRRPTVGRRPPEAEFIRRAGRPPAEGSVPIEIGLRRREEGLSGRRRPTVGRRPPEAEFIRRAGRRPKALCRLKSAFEGADAPGVGLRRRGACFFGRRRPTVGRRPLEAEFIRRAGRR